MAVNTTSLAVAGTGLGLILVSTVSSVSMAAVTILSQTKDYGLTAVYEDKDGVSTKECTNRYSAIIPKSFLGIFSLGGLGVSIALAVHATIGKDNEFRIEEYMNFALADHLVPTLTIKLSEA
jgi:hypothetical protein